jgi:hypothetical protein
VGAEGEIMNSLEIESTWSLKSPLAPLFQRGVIPPFVKGRSGGIYGACRDNYGTINITGFPARSSDLVISMLTPKARKCKVLLMHDNYGLFHLGVLSESLVNRFEHKTISNILRD